MNFKRYKILIIITIILLVFILLNPSYNNFKEFTGTYGKDVRYLHRTYNFLICSIYFDDNEQKKYFAILKNFIDITSKPEKSYTDHNSSTSVDSSVKSKPNTDNLTKRERQALEGLFVNTDSLKLAECTPDKALKNFNHYMNLYYPDYRIYGKPLVEKTSDCTFAIQFTSIDPHIRLGKEIFVVKVTIDYFNKKYRVAEVRGVLY